MLVSWQTLFALKANQEEELVPHLPPDILHWKKMFYKTKIKPQLQWTCGKSRSMAEAKNSCVLLVVLMLVTVAAVVSVIPAHWKNFWCSYPWQIQNLKNCGRSGIKKLRVACCIDFGDHGTGHVGHSRLLAKWVTSSRNLKNETTIKPWQWPCGYVAMWPRMEK